MKYRIISLFMAILMLLSALATVHAAEFSDITDHWAESYIYEAVERGLFNGMGENRFAPNETMSRGMFVTVLGRLAGVDLDFWGSEEAPRFFEDDVDPQAYYAPYVSWAVCNGIVNGVSATRFAPNDPITREQMAKLVALFTEKTGHTLLPAGEETLISDGFSDAETISSWAQPYVEALRLTGILNGKSNGDGTYAFHPQDTATRAEGAAVFCRLIAAMVPSEVDPAPVPVSISLDQTELTALAGDLVQLTATVLPEEAAAAPLLWTSSNPDVATVAEGLVTCHKYGKAEISVYTANGLQASCALTVSLGDGSIAPPDETKDEKCMRLFGEMVSDPRLYYPDGETAEAHMVEITVPVWNLTAGGEKVAGSIDVTVHENIAATVLAIFEEIFQGDEQFPIYAIVSYGYSGKSEHSIGTALDINPNENYYCDPDGNAIVGEYWKPGEDPYSIPLDGDVVNAFKNHGFTQGIYWRSGYKDYMHFSYFGT